MSYYQNLINHMEKCMRLHPDSTIVMDSDTFKVVATGKDKKTLARRMKKAKLGRRDSCFISTNESQRGLDSCPV